MKITKIITAILLISILLLVGCGKKECDTKEDCTSKGACFIPSCVKGVCDYKLRSGCTCGDGSCAKDENECTCPEDCGKCTGAVGEYMQKSCVENKCVTAVKNAEEKNVNEVIEYKEGTSKRVDLYLKYAYDEPFNVKKSLFNINLKIKTLYQYTTEVKIKKINIVEHTVPKDRYGNRKGDNPVTISEVEYSKTLFDENSEFDKSFPIFIGTMQEDSNFTQEVTLEITFEYKYKEDAKIGTYEKDISITFVNPSTKVVCNPADCNDQNPCTRDYCDTATNFCRNDIISTGVCCGDDICSGGEDRCQCQKDCGVCTGDIGTYMSMGCTAANVCAYAIKNPAVVQPTSKLADADFSGAEMSIKINYYTPFDKKNSMFSVVLEPKLIGDIIDFKVTKVTVLDSQGTILGEWSTSLTITEGSSQTATIPITYTTLEAEEEKTVKVRIDYSMNKPKTGGGYTATVNDYEYDIGKLTILNPA